MIAKLAEITLNSIESFTGRFDQLIKCICVSCKQLCATPSMCSSCKISVYCSRECQKKDFKAHKLICKDPNALMITRASRKDMSFSRKNEQEVGMIQDRAIEQFQSHFPQFGDILGKAERGERLPTAQEIAAEIAKKFRDQR